MVGLHEVAQAVLRASRSDSYVDDPVIMTGKALGLAGLLRDTDVVSGGRRVSPRH